MSALALHTKSVEPRSAGILPAGSAASCRRKRGAARGAAGCRPGQPPGRRRSVRIVATDFVCKAERPLSRYAAGAYEVVSLIGAGGMGIRTNLTSRDRKRLRVRAHEHSF